MRAIKSLKLTIPLTVFMAAVFLLLFAFTQSSYAISRSGSCGDNMSWELDDDGLLTISGSGEMDDYSTYGKVPWNTYKSKIKKVVISDGVTSIGDYAFYQCVNMKEIAIPDSMTRIGDRAFGTCRNLGNLVIPGKVTSIGDSCFYDCDGLTNVAIPGSVTSIGNSAFGSCNNIESVTLSYGIQSIGSNAFSYCEKITSVYLPSSLVSVGSSAFSRCSNIKEVHIDDIKSYLAIEFGNASANPVDHEASLYIKNELAEDLVIPEGVTSINSYAFESCISLRSVTLPEGVTNIADYAFYRCKNLKYITIPASVTNIGYDAFGQIASDYVVYAPKDSYASNNFHESHVVIRCSTHQWNTEYTIDEEATCTESGSKSIHCQVCGLVKDGTVEVIPATGHTFDQEVPDQKYLKTIGNCTDNPSVYYKSCHCGERGEETFTYAEHKWNTKYTVDKKATCLSTGMKSIHCSVCGSVKEGSQTIIPKVNTYGTGHFWDTRLVRQATIFSPGIEAYECERCGEKMQKTFAWTLDNPMSYGSTSYNIIGHTPIFRNSKSVTVYLQNPVKGSVVKVKIGVS